MNKKGQRNRVDDSEIELRVALIAKTILSGYSKRYFLFQKISDEIKEWGVGERQVDNYIKKAKKLIKNSYSKEDLSVEKDIALSRLEMLFCRNMKIQDFREARAATMDRVKLLGLDEPTKSEVKIVDKFSEMGDDELDEEIGKLDKI